MPRPVIRCHLVRVLYAIGRTFAKQYVLGDSMQGARSAGNDCALDSAGEHEELAMCATVVRCMRTALCGVMRG